MKKTFIAPLIIFFLLLNRAPTALSSETHFGIGMQLARETYEWIDGKTNQTISKTEILVVTEITAGGPADKAGVVIGDEVLYINNRLADEMSDEEIINTIRGPEKEITFGVLREEKLDEEQYITVFKKIVIQKEMTDY